MLRLWQQTELRHHRKTIRHAPMFYNFSVLQAKYIHDCDLESPAVGRPHEPAFVGSSTGHTQPNPVSIRDHIVDGQAIIGEGAI